MSGSGIVRLFNPAVGTALWYYDSVNKKAFAEMVVSSVELLGTKTLNLQFQHVFFSPKLSEEENAKTVAELAATLKSVGAINIKAEIVSTTPIVQEILARYEIPSVPVNGVDALTSAISKVCIDLIEKLSLQ